MTPVIKARRRAGSACSSLAAGPSHVGGGNAVTGTAGTIEVVVQLLDCAGVCGGATSRPVDPQAASFYSLAVMRRIVRSIPALLAAVAVFLVAVTCTPAGCLLSAAIGQHGTVRQCCGQHGDASHAPADGRKCPLCQNSSTILAKTAENNPVSWGHAGIQLLPPFLAPGALCSPGGLTVLDRSSLHLVPPEGPPTLLRLHCSLVI